MPAEPHFLNPGWLLALVPLGLLLASLARGRLGSGGWQGVVEPHLLAALTVGADGKPRRWPLALLGLGWLAAVLALANPTFERVSVPAFRDATARVVVLDLSQSMLVEDLAPTRLERARFKVEDILHLTEHGQVGLVVFAGDAFAVVPLTDDAETVRGMLSALAVEIMPAPGSRPDLGIGQALELLRRAGARDGEVVLLTDDAGGARARSAAAELRRAGHRLSVLGVGTEEGGAVPGVRTSAGSVMARLDDGALRSLARHGGGAYARITVDDADLRRVLGSDRRGQVRQEDQPRAAEIWKELGPWMVLGLLPLAALGFRRGWLLVPVLLTLSLGAAVPTPALAQAAADGGDSGPAAAQRRDRDWADDWGQRWRDLWQRRDQQAAQALQAGAFERALEVAQAPARLGAARYRLGDFDAAAEVFANGDGADDHYNRGNALAQAGRLEDALAAYDAALDRQPAMADALYNRQQVEEALRRREQQSGQQDQQAGEQSDQSQQGQSGQQPSRGAEGESGDDRQSGGPQANAGPQPQDREEDPEQDQGTQDAGASGDRSTGDTTTGADEHAEASQSSQSEQSEHAEPRPERQQAGTAPNERGDSAEAQLQHEGETAAEAAQRRASEAQAAEDYRDEAAAARTGDPGSEETGNDDAAYGGGDAPDTAALEARRAADQWLRRIPDDPSGLLRRKFLYQYQMRAGEPRGGPAEKPW